jgi:DNA polymerase sigma
MEATSSVIHWTGEYSKCIGDTFVKFFSMVFGTEAVYEVFGFTESYGAVYHPKTAEASQFCEI